MTPAAARSLRELQEQEAECTRCPLYKFATRVVPGEGPRNAAIMLVGEQPGNDEDLAGRPFVGPAGRILDRALADAELDRSSLFVTNAVKHFKFEPRGKRRLHKRPNTYEIDRCKWWSELERKIVKPRLVVALGATALRSLLGRPATVVSLHEKFSALADGTELAATIHPSFLLRIDEEDARAEEYRRFVSDLRKCRDRVAAHSDQKTTLRYVRRRTKRIAAVADARRRSREDGGEGSGTG